MEEVSFGCETISFGTEVSIVYTSEDLIEQFSVLSILIDIRIPNVYYSNIPILQKIAVLILLLMLSSECDWQLEDIHKPVCNNHRQCGGV